MNPSFFIGATLVLAALPASFLDSPAHAQQAAAFTTTHLFVATNGNDRWSGKLAAPNKAKTDGPLASIDAAREALRRARDGGGKGGATVSIRGGTYFLAQPLTFSPLDSGTADAPIVYENYPNETPVFSGGTRISGWKRNGNRWEVTLPEVREGRWNFVQLWANGRREMRPRLPKNGYYFIENALDPSPANAGKGHDRFGFHESDVRADWKNAGDIDFLMFQIWTMSRMRAASIDAASRSVQFTGTTRSTEWYGSFPKGHRYIVENVKEALSEAGQWYLDRPTGVLSYIPRVGETPATTEIIAPRLERLVEFAGDVAGAQWVSNITLRGLRFEHSNWTTPPEGNSSGQAEVNLSGAIHAVGARHVTLENCALSHIGIYGIDLRTFRFGRGRHQTWRGRRGNRRSSQRTQRGFQLPHRARRALASRRHRRVAGTNAV
jgi:hypothetical protein